MTQYMSVRKCKFCLLQEKDDKAEMIRQVSTGDWICMPCFNDKLRDNLVTRKG